MVSSKYASLTSASGNMLKVRETPKAASYQATVRKVVVARLIASGTVTTLVDTWAIRSQAPTFRRNTGKVQRLDGHGSAGTVPPDGLRYSPALGETSMIR